MPHGLLGPHGEVGTWTPAPICLATWVPVVA